MLKALDWLLHTTEIQRQSGYYRVDTPPDGSCQFEAISKALSSVRELPIDKFKVKEDIIAHLQEKKDVYAPFLVTDATRSRKISIEEYVEDLKQETFWGDEITIRCASMFFEVIIHVFDQNYQQPIIYNPREVQRNTPTLRLYRCNNNHYGAFIRAKTQATLQEQVINLRAVKKHLIVGKKYSSLKDFLENVTNFDIGSAPEIGYRTSTFQTLSYLASARQKRFNMLTTAPQKGCIASFSGLAEEVSQETIWLGYYLDEEGQEQFVELSWPSLHHDGSLSITQQINNLVTVLISTIKHECLTKINANKTEVDKIAEDLVKQLE